jgi:hypothetical protein
MQWSPGREARLKISMLEFVALRMEEASQQWCFPWLQMVSIAFLR